MIPVAEARTRILADVATVAPEETLPVARGLGRVLARDVHAPFDVPPADNSAVDGYAVRAAELAPGGSTPRARRRGPPGRRRLRGQRRPARDAPDHDRRAHAGAARTPSCRRSSASAPANGSTFARSIPARTCARAARTSGPGRSCCGPARCCDPRTSDSSRRSASPRCGSTGDRASPCSPPATRWWSPGHPRGPGQIYDANRFSLGGMVAGAGAEAARPRHRARRPRASSASACSRPPARPTSC